MAKVKVQIKDDGDHMELTLESDPPFPGPAASPEAKAAQTQAQNLGIHVVELLTGLSGNDQSQGE